MISLQKYAICPYCFKLYKTLVGGTLPLCDKCSSPIFKAEMKEVDLKETILLNILFKKGEENA